MRVASLALVSLVCFTIAAYALEIWPAYAHYHNDYASTGKWTAWFNGPILARDQQIVKDKLERDARASYSLTGDLLQLRAGNRRLSAGREGLRYFLAAAPADSSDLIGTWVASNTLVSGRRSAATPVIIDSRSARSLGVGPGDSITLEVKLADASSNEVQGRFTAVVTAVARPTAQFKGVALESAAMRRFIASAQQVTATDLHVFGGSTTLPQDLARALSADQIKGALRADLIGRDVRTLSSRASALRYSIAAAAIIILGVYSAGELISRLQAEPPLSKRRARTLTIIDLLLSAVVFLSASVAAVFLAGALIRLLMQFEPPGASTIQTLILFLALSALLICARASIAQLIFKRRGAEITGG